MRYVIAGLFLLTPQVFATGMGGGFDIMSFIPLLLIFVIFYFLILRPQQKKARAHQDMIKSLQRGDRVLTSGGIIATVDKIVNDTEALIEIADGVKVRVLKATVTDLMAKTHPTHATAEQKHHAVKHEDAHKEKISNAAKKPVKAIAKKTNKTKK